MSRPHAGDRPITSRPQLERAVAALIAEARANGVHVEGASAAPEREDPAVGGETDDAGPAVGAETDEADQGDVAVRASLAQVLTGLPLGTGDGSPACASCGAALVDGAPVTATASAEGTTWRVRDAYCRDCSPDERRPDRPDRAGVRFAATATEATSAARQAGRTVAGDVRVLAYRPPPEGLACR